jgi:hypothetical protein
MKQDKINWNDSVAYRPYAKIAFHKAAQKQLRKLAKALFLDRAQYDLRSNKAGIAVSGEITLHTDAIYIQAAQSCLGGDTGLLIRQCDNRKDYTGRRNHFLPLAMLDDTSALAHYVRRLIEAPKENNRDLRV